MPDRSTSAGLLQGAALLLFALLLLAPLLYYPFARDHGMYAVVAETISRGGMPYADAWDLKTPGIFFVFQAALSLFGKNMWGVRVLELLSLAGTALALWRLGLRLDMDRRAGLLGAAFFLLFLGQNLNYWHTAQAESFLMLPLVLSILFAVRALDGGMRRGHALAAGLSGIGLGLVFVFKFPNILPLACCLPLLFHRGLLPGTPRRILFPVFAACALLPPAITAAWFAMGGALGHLWEALFVFAPRYAGITVSTDLLLHGLKVFARFFLPGQGMLLPKWLCLAGLLLLVRRQGAARLVLPLWFLLSLLVIWIQGKFFLYHYLPLYLPCALLAGTAAAAASRALAERAKGDGPSKQRTGIVAAALIIAVSLLLGSGTLRGHWQDARSRDLTVYRDGTDFSLAADLEVAEHLRRITAPGETIFIWGYETLVYFLSDRHPANRFITHQPLASRWQMPGWRDEALADLRERPPARILVLRRDAMPAVTGSTLDSAGLLGEFPELQRLINQRYQLETEIEDFLIYRPLDTGPLPAPATGGNPDNE